MQVSREVPAWSGIAVGVSASASITVVRIFLLGRCQRRKRGSGKLMVLPPAAVSDSTGVKAELAGSEAVEGARLRAIEKAEFSCKVFKRRCDEQYDGGRQERC